MEMSTEKFLKDLDAGSVVMRLDKFVLFNSATAHSTMC